MSIKEITFHLKNVLEGRPWYGKSVTAVLSGHAEVDEDIKRLLNHMLAWRNFAWRKICGEDYEIEVDSDADWPKDFTRSKDDILKEFKLSNDRIIEAIESKPHEWLREKIKETSYNFQFLLEGVVQHDIYHLGQVALLLKKKSGKEED